MRKLHFPLVAIACLAVVGALMATVLIVPDAARPVGSAGRIAYQDGPVGSETWIAVAELGGAEGVELTRRKPDGNRHVDSQPLWSPDGAKLAFVRDKGRSSALFIVGSDGTGLTRLSGFTPSQKRFSWSPDSTRLAFVTSTRKRWCGNETAAARRLTLNVVMADGGGGQRVTIPLPHWGQATDGYMLGWSPDGTRLLYKLDVAPPHSCYFWWRLEASALYRIDLHGRAREVAPERRVLRVTTLGARRGGESRRGRARKMLSARLKLSSIGGRRAPVAQETPVNRAAATPNRCQASDAVHIPRAGHRFRRR